MSRRMCCYVLDKLVKSCYALLLIVLMTLWIVICVESTRQINDVYHKQMQGRAGLQERRTWPNVNSAVAPAFTRATLPRLYLLAIFNTLIEEVIALGAILSIILRARQLFVVTLALLTLIWFIEQYRIADFYHHIDSIDWQSSQIIIATHAIHFVIIVIGLILLFTERHDMLLDGTKNEQELSPASATSLTTNGTIVSVNGTNGNSRLIEIDKSDDETPCKIKKQCNWMRSTFIKRKGHESNGKATKTNNRQAGFDSDQVEPVSIISVA